MPTDKPTLTPDQRRGVETVGRSLLMSAAAGSGKTRVLAERCAYLVCDAPPPHRCDVDELLVVTFTEAAAAEMRDRIGRALEARTQTAAGRADARLDRQRALLDQAQISTLHSFCANLLRQHFHLVGLDPAFAVMDAHEAALLRLDVGRALLRDRYAADTEGSFQRLLDGYVEGDDEALLREILRVHDLQTSLVDPDGWAASAAGRIAEAGEGNLLKTELGKHLVALLKKRIVGMGQRCNSALAQLATYRGFEPYVKRVEEIRQTCRHLYLLVDKAGLDAVAEVARETTFDRLPAVSNNVPDKEVAKDAVDGVTKEFKEGSWRTLLNFTADEWQDGLRRVRPHADELLRLVREFGDRYRDAKREARQVDFADLERLALRVLRDDRDPAALRPSATARHYHRLFRHVLVDEYQDINELQNAILYLVSRECLGERAEGRRRKADQDAGHQLSDLPSAHCPPPSNLFCVGDVKQSIYRFRLADPEQFLRREAALRRAGSGGEVIDLKQNFRSRGPLLEAVNAIFARLMTKSAAEIDYDDTQRLVSGRAFADPGGRPVFEGAPIELHLLARSEEPAAGDGAGASADAEDDGDAGWDRTEREAAFVARRILALLGKDGLSDPTYVYDRDGGAPRPASYRDVVILLRSKRYKANQFVRILEGFGVPTHAESGSGFFESTEVRDLIALLCLMDNGRQDLELAAYLRSPLARLNDPEDALAAVRIAYRDLPFHEAVARYADEQQGALATKLAALLDELAELRRQANRRPAHETVWAILDRTGYLAYVAGLPGGEQRSANLMELYDRARRFATHRRQGLGRFLEYLQTLEAESDVGVPSVATEAQDVVRIMTVHASKGLEFPIVIVPDCGKRINLRDEMGPILLDRTLGLGMAVADEGRHARYPSLAQVLVRDGIHRKAMAEELRVLYVALTRAMEHLILVGTARPEAAEGWRRRWTGHDGPLPEATVVGAGTLLDWLGPVWAATRSAGEAWVDVEQHALEGLEDPKLKRRRHEPSPRVRALCDRRPVEPAPAALDPDVRRALDRLTYAYPFEPQTRQPAAAGVGSLARRSPAPAREPGGPAAGLLDGTGNTRSVLTLPAFAAPAAGPPGSRAGAGDATRLALRHLRFAAVNDWADVERQLDEMVAARKLLPDERAAVDVGAIEWFARSDLGRLAREHEPRLLRDLPVHFAAPAAGGGSGADLDATMIRGRIDLVVPLPGGGVVMAYATEAASGEPGPAGAGAADAEAARQVDACRGRLGHYADALGRITGRPAVRRYAVLLHARRIAEV